MKFLYILAVTLLLSLVPQTGWSQANVPVRAGIHERSNRLVFDWTHTVGYTTSQNGNTYQIQFETPATAQMRSVMSVNPPFIKNIKQQNNAKGLLVTFDIPDKARVETFRLDSKIAFDVLHMDSKPPSFSGAGTTIPAENQTRTAADQKQPETKPAQEPVQPSNTQQEKPATLEEPPPPVAPAATPNTVTVPNTSAGFRTLADELEGKPSERGLQAPSSSAPATADQQQTPATIKGTVIRLNPGENQFTKLAAFTRAGKLWIVLDKALPKLMPKVEGENVDVLSKNARRIDQPKATAFALDIPEGKIVYSIRRDKTEWQIWLNPGDRPYLPDDISVNVVQANPKASSVLTLYTGEQPSVIQMKDSATGERLWIVPVRSPEGRISQPRLSPGYEFLQTLMGAAVILRDDNLQIGVAKDLVQISAKDNKKMLLSNPTDRAKGLQEALLIPMFRLDVPELKTKTFTERRQELQDKLTEVAKDPAKKSLLLMDMARLYISEGFGQEAAGLLRIARSINKPIEATREFHALRGMASALSGDQEQAEEDLKMDQLQSQPAAKLWLGYAYAQNSQWQAARAVFVDSAKSEQSFPEKLQPRLILAKAESALETNDIVTASQELKKITDTKKLRPAEVAAHDYIGSAIALATDDKKAALPALQELAKGNNQLYRVKAELELVAQKVAAKEMDNAKAIERLERLRFSWRGDRLEIQILRQLGQYYINNGQYMDGLTLWRQAAGLSQNTDDTDAITENMQNVFKKLYVEGDADKMQPLQAVALFQRFRELTPPGAEGTKALTRLADRLASVDLLDQADALLEKQFRQNATGEEAAMMGAKLASWRLLNGNASGALKALDESTQETALPEELSQGRLLLRARALADTGKVDEGLALLNTVQSDEGLRLKADINWRQNRWSDALTSLQALVTNYRNEGKTAVDGPMPGLIMKMGIALTLDGNTKGMELLKAQYGEYMATTPRAQAFNLITTQSRGSSLADLDTLKNQVNEVELFQTFLKNFGK